MITDMVARYAFNRYQASQPVVSVMVMVAAMVAAMVVTVGIVWWRRG